MNVCHFKVARERERERNVTRASGRKLKIDRVSRTLGNHDGRAIKGIKRVKNISQRKAEEKKK
jgi:hypothetical protein